MFVHESFKQLNSAYPKGGGFMETREHTHANLQLLREQLDSGRMRSARLMIHSLHPSEVARLLESMPLRERAILWEMVEPDDEGDVLVEVADEVRDGLIKGMQTEELIAATEGMELDDLADLLTDLPETVTLQVLQSLDQQDRVYGADIGNNSIQVFDKTGTFISMWGRGGSGPGEFGNLHGLIVDAQGNVYIGDTANHRVQKFRPVE